MSRGRYLDRLVATFYVLFGILLATYGVAALVSSRDINPPVPVGPTYSDISRWANSIWWDWAFAAAGLTIAAYGCVPRDRQHGLGVALAATFALTVGRAVSILLVSVLTDADIAASMRRFALWAIAGLALWTALSMRGWVHGRPE